MAELAGEIAHILLREGCFDQRDPDHRELYARLMGDSELYSDVKRRLALVGYQLVDRLGHAGVRLATGTAQELAKPGRNRMGLHAGHVRLLVYLWTHLVYREWSDLRHDVQSAAPGAEQADFFGDPDEAIWIAYSKVLADFSEVTNRSRFKGYLAALRRWRFVRYDEKRDRIWAAPARYTLISLNEMEDFVVDLARRMGTEQPAEAVDAIVRGSTVPASEGSKA